MLSRDGVTREYGIVVISAAELNVWRSEMLYAMGRAYGLPPSIGNDYDVMGEIPGNDFAYARSLIAPTRFANGWLDASRVVVWNRQAASIRIAQSNDASSAEPIMVRIPTASRWALR